MRDEDKTREELIKELESLRASIAHKDSSDANQRIQTAEMLKTIMDKTQAIIFVKDTNGRFLFASRQYEERMKMAPGSLIGKTNHDIFPKELADRLRENDAAVLRSGRSMEFEEVGRHGDGVDHTYISLKFPLTGIPGAICGISTDITERKRIEAALRQSEFFLNASQRIARLGTYVFDIKTNQFTSSAMLDEIFGIGKGYTRSVSGWLDTLHPDERGRIDTYLNVNVLKRREPFDMEYRIIRHDDSLERWVHGLGALELDSAGEPVRMIGTVQDVTERKKTEELLKSSLQEKIESLKKVQLLSGLLPICATCKKIRNNGGKWENLESYIEEHSEADFTHSICPDCSKKFIKEL